MSGQALRYADTIAGIDWQALIDDLVADAFHNGRTTEQLRASFANSAVVAIAWDGDRVVGTARALSDGVGNAYVVDVWTQSAYRGRGIGSELMSRLVAALDGQHVYLFTDDAVAFYEKLGFRRQGVGMSRVIGRYLYAGPTSGD